MLYKSAVKWAIDLRGKYVYFITLCSSFMEGQRLAACWGLSLLTLPCPILLSPSWHLLPLPSLPRLSLPFSESVPPLFLWINLLALVKPRFATAFGWFSHTPSISPSSPRKQHSRCCRAVLWAVRRIHAPGCAASVVLYEAFACTGEIGCHCNTDFSWANSLLSLESV